jgi:hypothetical protein
LELEDGAVVFVVIFGAAVVLRTFSVRFCRVSEGVRDFDTDAVWVGGDRVGELVEVLVCFLGGLEGAVFALTVIHKGTDKFPPIHVCPRQEVAVGQHWESSTLGILPAKSVGGVTLESHWHWHRSATVCGPLFSTKPFSGVPGCSPLFQPSWQEKDGLQVKHWEAVSFCSASQAALTSKAYASSLRVLHER